MCIRDSASFSMDQNRIQISNARVTLGQSQIDASGTLQEQVQFNARLATDELERLLRMAPTHVGMVQVSGKGRVNPPQSIDLSELRVAALGGAFAGNASLANM